MKKSFAEVLEELREQQQISKKDLTQRTGLSSGYISLLTRGGRTAPSQDTVDLLAEALTLDPTSRVRLFEAAGYSPDPAISSMKSPRHVSRREWGDIPNTQVFYGREQELERLEHWVVSEQCQLVSVLGMGGVGKTLLSAKLAEKIQTEFEYVIWRSLQNAPPVEYILSQCLHFFSDQNIIALPEEVADQIDALIERLREHRCLIILDNFETVLQASSRAGYYQDRHQDYGKLLQQVGKVRHRSCLLITSREKPKEIAELEGEKSSVRSFSLVGLKPVDGIEILRDKGLRGSEEHWNALIDYYAGNPLALKLVSQFIQEAFDGEISSFLKDGSVIFSDIRGVLDQQFDRLTTLEKDIMYWLAIDREAIQISQMTENLLRPPTMRDLLEAVSSLKRRSMIETRKSTRYTSQPVIMEYVTDRLVDQAYGEIISGEIGILMSYALMKAQAKDYVRETQSRLILEPLIARLSSRLEVGGVEKRLRKMLHTLRETDFTTPGYAAGNVLNLLIHLNVDLQGSDLSYLTVRQAHLQRVLLRDVNFTSSDLSQSVFTDAFGSIFSIALNGSAKLLAAGTANGEIGIWTTADTTPFQTLRGHTEWVRSVAFSSSEEYILASGSEDLTVRIWDVRTGECLNILKGHGNTVYSVAFSSDGNTVVSGSDDQTIRLWDVSTGGCLRVFEGHTSRIFSVAISADGKTIVSGSGDQTIRLWDVSTGRCLRVFEGHTNRVRSVAFSPDGKIIASGGGDQTIRLWDAHTGDCLKKLEGHTDWIWSIVFSPDGKMLASGSDDQTVRIWNVASGECHRILQGSRVYSVAFSAGYIIATGGDRQTVQLWDADSGECLKTLQGHGSRVYSVSFSSNNSTIASGHEDGAVRLWEAFTGKCLRELPGHAHWVWSVAFSSNEMVLASGSEDRSIWVWNVHTGEWLRKLHGHVNRVYCVAFSPDGNILASSSGDQMVRLWDVRTGECLKLLEGHKNRVYCVAFSPDGNILASSSGDQMVRLWDVRTGECFRELRGHTMRVRSVAFGPTGETLASGGDDQMVKIWDFRTGQCLKQLEGHTGWIWSVAYSSDGSIIASGGEDQTVRLWATHTGECREILKGKGNTVYSVTFSPDGKVVVGGSHGGLIEIWEVETGKHLRTLRSPRPYERMNITDVRGLNAGQKAILKALGAVEDQPEISLATDPRSASMK
jgi:WD40 repeat protein/transcriptional regulator with XRE-family HTH domain